MHTLRTSSRLISAALLAFGALLSGCAGSAGGDGTFKKGLELAEAGKVAEAIKVLEGGVGAHPDNLRMRFELARLQYETGEALHLQERQALRLSGRLNERGRRREALVKQREGTELRGKATPHYRNARTHLRYVVGNEDDDERIAWASYLLMRVDVFFKDWEAAYENIERAIRLGKPRGLKRSAWREYQAGIKDKMSLRRLGP